MSEMHPKAPQPALEVPVQLPAAFWPFHRQYYSAYREYARLQLGDRQAVNQLTH